MKLLAVIIVITLVMSITLPNAFALTKEGKAEQLKQREQALAEAKAYKGKSLQVQIERNLYKIIAVELSKSCQTAIKTNSTKCPNYKQFISYDTTDQRYYGKFKIVNDTAIRMKGPIHNPFIIDQNRTDYVICVDCPQKVLPHAKLIEIVPDNFVYLNHAEIKIINNTRYEYHDQFVDPGCSNAMIPFELLNSTLIYLKSDCKNKTYEPRVTIQTPYSKVSYDGAEYKYQKWLKEAKLKAVEKAKAYCKTTGSKCYSK